MNEHNTVEKMRRMRMKHTDDLDTNRDSLFAVQNTCQHNRAVFCKYIGKYRRIFQAVQMLKHKNKLFFFFSRDLKHKVICYVNKLVM